MELSSLPHREAECIPHDNLCVDVLCSMRSHFPGRLRCLKMIFNIIK